ncbi:MAG: AHH domain-containing protein [Pirellulales bacterium]
MAWGESTAGASASDLPERVAEPPDEAWVFAQTLLGRPIPSPSAVRAEARAKREQLAWLASISRRHEQQLHDELSRRSATIEDRERLEWLASFSPRHERERRRLQAAEAEVREARARYERLVEDLSVQEADWDPSKHPRLGRPPNAGWFASKGGASGGGGARGEYSAQAGYSSTEPTKTTTRRNGLPSNRATAASVSLAKQASRPSSKPPQPTDRSGGEATDSAKTSEISEGELLSYFELLYGEQGQRLLKAFHDSGGLLKLKTPWFSKSALDTRNAWRPHQIRIQRDLNPIEAAQELMERLIEASGLTEVRQHLDHTGFTNIEALIASYKESARQAAATAALAAELVESGISIASEGADWVITIHELSEGNYYAAIGLLPLLPAAVGKTGVILKHGAQSLRIPAKSASAVKALPVKQLLELLESTRKLARNMEKAGIKRPPNTAAHHIVPAALDKFPSAGKARAILAKFGIDLQNAANGVYLPSKFDNAVKAAYHGTLHTKEYFDEVYARLRVAKSAEEALDILNEIRRDLLSGKFPR